MYSLTDDMQFVRDYCSAIHAARKAVGIPTSQPLQSVTLYKGDELSSFVLQFYSKIIADECNVKTVDWELIFDGDYRFYDIKADAKLDFKSAGKLFGRDVQTIGKLVREGEYTTLDENYLVGEFVVPGDLISSRREVDNTLNQKSLGLWVGLLGEESFFVLDTKITEDLYWEKLARDITKLINTERRARGFAITDDVVVVLDMDQEHAAALWYNHSKVSQDAKCNPQRGLERPGPVSVQSMKLKEN